MSIGDLNSSKQNLIENLTLLRIIWLTTFFPLLGGLLLFGGPLALAFPGFFFGAITLFLLTYFVVAPYYLGFAGFTGLLSVSSLVDAFKSPSKKEILKFQIPLQSMFLFGMAGCVACVCSLLFPAAAPIFILLTAVFFTLSTANSIFLLPKKYKIISVMIGLFNTLAMGMLVINGVLGLGSFFGVALSLASLMGPFAAIPAAMLFLVAPMLCISYCLGNYEKNPKNSLIMAILSFGYFATLGGLALYIAGHVAAAASVLTTVGLGATATAMSAVIPFAAPVLIGIAVVGAMGAMAAVGVLAAIAIRCIYKNVKSKADKNDIEMPAVVDEGHGGKKALTPSKLLKEVSLSFKKNRIRRPSRGTTNFFKSRVSKHNQEKEIELKNFVAGP